MKGISDFFHKFLNLEKNSAAKTAAVIRAIKQTTGVELLKETIEIKGEILRIKTNPVLRNEIFLHKTQIEDLLKSQKIFLSIV